MGTTPSKGKSNSPRIGETVDQNKTKDFLSEKNEQLAKLRFNSRLANLKPLVSKKLEDYLQEESVSEIVLERFGLQEIPLEGIFLKTLKLESLKSLILNFNQLDSLPEFLGLQPFISTVSLSNNQFTSIPPLGNTVTYLNLSWNKLTIIDENVSQLIHLKHLDLHHNYLGDRALPDLSDLSLLEYLDLSENRITSWPRISAPNLAVFKLDFNDQLPDCPASFGALPSLHTFSASHTRMIIFPKFLMSSNRLTYLNLRNTLIAKLPQNMDFPLLKYLDFSATKFVPSSEQSAEIHKAGWVPPKTISDEVQASMKGLESLANVSDMNLNGIGLLHLPTSLFNVLSSDGSYSARIITRICLRWNNLSLLPEELFDLTSLEVLDVLGNKLTSIPPTIKKLKSLIHLSIAHNKITKLPTQITKLKNLKVMVIEDNPWEDALFEKLYFENDDVQPIFERIKVFNQSSSSESEKRKLRLAESDLQFSTPHLTNVPQIDEDETKDLYQRVLGLIFGMAIGDAVGLSSEFLMHVQATFSCDTDRIDLKHIQKDRHRIRWRTGDWTDDTDQAILLLEQILYPNTQQVSTSQEQKDDSAPSKKSSKASKSSNADCILDPKSFAKELLQWAENGFAELGDDGGMGIGATVSKVLRHSEFLNDPKAASREVWASSGFHLAANGAIMRCAPLALIGFDETTDSAPSWNLIRQNTLDSCLVTHFDPRCVASCWSLNYALALMLRGEREMNKILDFAFQAGKMAFVSKDQNQTNSDVPASEIQSGYLSGSDIPTEKYPEYINELESMIKQKHLGELDLGDGSTMGYTYKCLGSAFAVFRSSNDFKQSIIKMVQQAGDADTNGAVAGALLGCKLGFEAIPKEWLELLPHYQWLHERAQHVWEKIQERRRKAKRSKRRSRKVSKGENEAKPSE